MQEVLAPLTGIVLAQADTPDQVFADGLVGPGCAIDPDRQGGGLVVAPIAGTVVKMMPHAFIISSRERPGLSVLVHVGIDTAQLQGEGFTLLLGQGDEVEAGAPALRWDPATVEAGGRSPVVPVVVLDGAPNALLPLAAPGSQVAAGDPLFLVA
ncbi:MAG: PTS glucose transporter subunit IIA [Promicromonosporaceae bacterium]|nr:PTS glucose transporter subunit IIA [Promicromonosporaceae bacterium]